MGTRSAETDSCLVAPTRLGEAFQMSGVWPPWVVRRRIFRDACRTVSNAPVRCLPCGSSAGAQELSRLREESAKGIELVRLNGVRSGEEQLKDCPVYVAGGLGVR